MSSFLGRNSRRRRVLSEEALSASSAHLAWRAVTPDDPVEETPRYSDAAGVEHHPQVTDFFPRRYRTIGMLGVIGLGTTAVVEALHYFVTPLSASYGYETAAAFDLTGVGGIAAWLSGVVLALSSVTCLLIYTLRRHRIDDFQGRYRIWMAAAIGCAILSVESVAPVHRMLSAAAAYHTGWTGLRSHAAWWLGLAVLPLAWIGLRAWLDARESRLSAVSLGVAFTCYGVATASFLGLGAEVAPPSEVMITAGAALVGHWMLLVGVVSYGRFVVLDAQGLIPVSRGRQTDFKSGKVAKDREVKDVASHSDAATSNSPLHAFRESRSSVPKVDSKSTQWVDGTEPVSEGYDEEDGNYNSRKLNKADRKKLRKLKARDRAA